MFSIAHLYNSACSYTANPVRINPIFMSIIFHHYRQLTMIAKQIETTQKDHRWVLFVIIVFLLEHNHDYLSIHIIQALLLISRRWSRKWQFCTIHSVIWKIKLNSYYENEEQPLYPEELLNEFNETENFVSFANKDTKFIDYENVQAILIGVREGRYVIKNSL